MLHLLNDDIYGARNNDNHKNDSSDTDYNNNIINNICRDDNDNNDNDYYNYNNNTYINK